MGIGLRRIGAPAAASDVRSSRSSCYVPTVNVLTPGSREKQTAPGSFASGSNDYVFERRVDYKFDDGTTARRRIDLYKRDCFVMEAKQSAKRIKAKKADPDQPELIPEDATPHKSRPAQLPAARGAGTR